MNMFHREVPRVLNLFPRELIEGTPKDFSKANQRPHQRPDPRPKPRGFLDEGLAKDATEGLPDENSERGL